MPMTILSRFPIPCTQPVSSSELLNRATTIACIAYQGQKRKDGVTPEIHHALSVQRLVIQAGIDDANISAACLLHDALANNTAGVAETLSTVIRTSLGQEVFDLVSAVTDDASPGLSKSERKARQFLRLAGAPWAVQVIKLADVTASLLEGPPPIWTLQNAAHYVHQRNKLVTEVLQDSSAELALFYQQALEMPVWKNALSYVDEVPQRGL